MSASIGPKIFTLTGDELHRMMAANYESNAAAVDEIDKAIALEENEDVKASLGRWREKFVTDGIETKILMAHSEPKGKHYLTGTELIGIFRTFRTVHVNIAWLKFNVPPTDVERPEHRLANTAAAVPRSQLPENAVRRIWTPGLQG